MNPKFHVGDLVISVGGNNVLITGIDKGKYTVLIMYRSGPMRQLFSFAYAHEYWTHAKI